MKQKLRVFLTLLLCAVASVGWGQTTVTDELTYSLIGVTGTNYSSWTGKTSNSDAVYAGKTAGDKESIQLRSNGSDCGIVTTSSGGRVKSITIEWNDDTNNARVLDVWLKNSAYSSAENLYSANTQGDKRIQFKKSDGTQTISIDGDYTYIGIRSNSGAMYIDKITIVWETGGDTPVDPSVATTTTIDATGITNTDVYTGTEAGQLTASVMANDTPIQGAVVTWNSSNSDVATIDANGNVTLVAEGKTIITAYYAGVENQYKPSEDSYELTVTDSSPFSGGDVTFIAGTDVGTTTGNSSPDQVTKNGVTISATDAAFATAEYRFYKNSETTISTEQGVITQIAFIATSNYPASGFAAQDGWTTEGNNGTWTGSAQSVSFTASGAQVRATKIIVTVDLNAAPDPVINASDVNITYDASDGNIGYTIDNPIEGTSLTAVVKEGNWLELGNVTGNSVSFTCDANTESVARTSVVTLTYGDVTKDVTVTQAAAPAALKTIAKVREQGTGNVTTKGVVTSCVGTTAYIQDATAAICVYGNELTVGDEIKVSGTLSTYKGLLEITEPEITVLSQNNTVNPEVMTIAQVNESDKQGWLVKIENATVTAINGQNTTIAQGDATIAVHGISGVEYEEGDILTLTGNIGCYNTVQIANPQNVTVQQNTTPSINASDAVNLAADAISGEIAYEINNPIDGTTLLASTSADWISNFSITTDKVTFTTAANTGAERTATITLTYGDVTKDITVTQAAYIAPITGDKYVKVTSTNDITNGQYLIVYEEGSVAFNGGLETLDVASNTIEVVINNNEIGATDATAAAEFTIDVTAGTLKSASGQYIGVSSNSNGLKQTDNAETYTHTFSIDTDGNAVVNAVFENSTMALRYNKNSGQTRFRYFKNAGQEAIQLYKKVSATPQPETVKVNISDVGMATFSSANALDFTDVENIYAYTATIDGDKISFTRVYQVPAETGLLLRNPNGGKAEADVPVIENVTLNVENAFVAVLEEIASLATTADGGTNYILNKKGDNVGFYKANSQKVGAGKAYLHVPASVPVREFIGFDEETDGIEQIENGQLTIENAEIYNLSGQRVNKAQKGIYIVNGKKVVVK